MSADERASSYSNVPVIALGLTTVISLQESNSKAGKRGPVNDAVVGTMVGMVVLVAHGVGGGG